MSKVLSFKEAAKLIQDGDSLVISSLISVLCPEKFLAALEERFQEEGQPRNLKVFTPCRAGWTPGTGIEHLAHPGLLQRLVSGSFSSKDSPVLARMINENQIAVYSYSMGVMYEWVRALASGQPGLLTEVGLDTYVDPRREGGKFTSCCSEDLVKVIAVAGREMLHYQPFPVDVAIIRGTTADEFGNISLEEEPVTLGVLAMAQVAKANGGKVIAQVKRLARRGHVPCRQVVVPGALVDAVVVDPDQEQSMLPFNPYWTGEVVAPWDMVHKDLPLNARKVVLRRAALEMSSGDLVNLGVGIPVDLPFLALEEKFLDLVTFSTEHGAVGGVPSGVQVFGTHINPEAIIDAPSKFSMYHGGCLDVSFLGFAEIDQSGNVNVSRFGPSLRGSGGFIDIVHRTKKVVFCGTLTSGGLKAEIRAGTLTIVQEGKHQKFVPQVQQVTFSAQEAVRKGQEVLYITERAVFRLEQEGLVLIEYAPGLDTTADIMAQVGFPVCIDAKARPMNSSLFREEPVGLAKIIATR